MEKPILSGVLYKRARKSGSNWKKRFFELYQNKLNYYFKTGGKVRGVMEFTEEFFVQDGPAPKGKFGFIITDFFSTHYLAADTSDVKDFWMLAIATIIRRKLEASKFFGDRMSKKLAAATTEMSEDEQERQYQARLDKYYQAVGRPEEKKNRRSIVDLRAAQVYAEAIEAKNLVDDLKQKAVALEKEGADERRRAELARLAEEAERERKRLEAEAQKMREVAERGGGAPSLSLGVAEPALEEGEEEEEEEEEDAASSPSKETPRMLAPPLEIDERKEDSAIEAVSLRRKSLRAMAPPLPPRKNTITGGGGGTLESSSGEEFKTPPTLNFAVRRATEDRTPEKLTVSNPPTPFNTPTVNKASSSTSLLPPPPAPLSPKNSNAALPSTSAAITSPATATSAAATPAVRRPTATATTTTTTTATSKPTTTSPSAPVSPPKEESTTVGSGIKSKLGIWQKKVDEHHDKQAANVFSGSYAGGSAPVISKDQYGKAPEGSKTEERAKAAQDWVEKEIERLVKIILELGEFDPEEGGIKTVKFGPLFYHYANITDSLVGILMRAKKRNRIKYVGDMLFQSAHDHVKITVLVS